MKPAKAPLVSILCLTYNHRKFIKQALDSFIFQKTAFDFELLIHDDASDDGTKKIIEDYAEKYPRLIKFIFQKENQFSQGKRNFFVRYLIPKSKGKYLALCEGDDYWTDPLKLQRQADFMEKHPDYTLCFHPSEVVFEDGDKKSFIYPNIKNHSWYNIRNLLCINYIPTSSVFYRKREISNFPLDVMPGDWFLHLYHARFGKIKFLDKTMSVYRKHRSGLWWEYDQDRDQIWRKYGIAHLSMQNELLKLYQGNVTYENTIRNNINNLLKDFIRVDKKYNEELLKVAIVKYPGHVYGLILNLVSELQSIQKNQKLRSQIKNLKQIIESLEKQLSLKSAELDRIKSSRYWKFWSALHRMLN